MATGDTGKISAQEEADLSSALIAKLLAEDSIGTGQYSGYYEDYGDGAAYGNAPADDDEYVSGNEGDGDWDPSMKRRRKPKGTGRPRGRLGDADGDMAEAASSDDGPSDVGRGKRPRKHGRPGAAARKERPAPQPVAPGQYRAGAYTSDEEQRFCEGLEKYGRSWSQISEYVITRDAKSIRSHAQKYFIKLFRDKAPLPAKVRETGDGYTLSGRPLDPNSAAARPYLQHVMQLDPPPARPPRPALLPGPADPPLADAGSAGLGEGAGSAGPTEGASNAGLSEGTGNAGPSEGTSTADSAPKAAAVCTDTAVLQQTQDAAHGGDGGDGTGVGTSPSSSAAPGSEDQGAPLASPTRTEYAMSRPQRSHVRPVALRYDDPHQMVRCTPFAGLPQSNVAGSQPFRLVVHTNAQLAMDFHAHLMLSEVIGLLGGRWDAKERVLAVTRAFPCTALETSDAHTNVEMDPGSELVVRHQITEAGLRVVGWYHSHPTFRPDPSIIDIENQTAYQKLFRDKESAEEPFVGAIVGPYDPELPGPVSVFNWFWVGKSAVDRGHPKRLAVEATPDCELSTAEHEMLLQLLDDSGSLAHRAPLEEAWRPSSTELRSLKMVVSLAHRMPWIAGTKNSTSPETPPAPAGEADDAGEAGDTGEADDTGDTGEAGVTVEARATEADSTSNSTAAEAIHAAPAAVGRHEACSKHIPHARLLAGQRAAQDRLLSTLCRRFTAGIFKAGASGEPADPHALACVLAAYFTQLS
ncbi:hypothetical protein LPJ61_000656 [Coemansia biformis]|uniref:Myb-like, SWIRM and MPN domain-containing protein 1 n=1 Tax=Coemansia biformis TaxID=1286918 RepID=A0A9W7YHY5_9FUNG|nr:hypothetical protein LPJ61_000656 [Coemansia biformis]